MVGTNVPEPPVSLWRNRQFLLLWTGQSLSLIGDWFFSATLMLWMLEALALGERWLPLATSGVALSATLPALLLGPLAGVFVDRWSRRWTMLWTDVARFAVITLFLLLTLVVANRTVLLISCLAVLLLVACGSQFFQPARVAVVADLVPEAQHLAAYGALQQAGQVAQIAGPAVAAPLYVALGPTWAIALNAASFLVSCLLLLPIHASLLDHSEPPKKVGFWRAFREGWTFFVHSRVLVTLIVCAMLFMFGGMAYNALEYLYGRENLHIPPEWLGVFAGCYGLGIALGLPLMAALARRSRIALLYGVSLIANGLAMLVLSRVTTMIPGMICELASGLVSASILLTRQPLTVLVTPRDLLGRVTAFQTPLITLASLAGGALAGTLATTVLSGLHVKLAGMTFGRLDTILVGIGVLTMGAGVFALLILAPAINTYRAKQVAEREVPVPR